MNIIECCFLVGFASWEMSKRVANSRAYGVC